jgi:hypothetical protein
LADANLGPLPTQRPEIGVPRRGAKDFCWESLVASTIHPVKVAIVEALQWINEPLSATELTEIFGHDDYNLDIVLYHLRGLVRLDVIEVTARRHARGAQENFFFFR